MNSQTGLPLGFEFVDIEIINHKNENDIDDRWNCDHCSLFFLSKDKLELHQKVHSFVEDTVHCKYCNKVLTGEESKECYSNKKCETCEYRCSQCPQRFLRQSSLLNHEKNHLTVKKRRSRNITFHTKQADEVDAQANNSSKKRKALKNNPEESLIETDSLQPIISPKKKSKVESDGFSPEKSKASTFVNISSRRSSRKILPDKSLTSPDKSKLNESVNKVQVVAMTDGSAKENSVNYKPFSCHVCGETFASDNGLLEHIKTHGDNAAETFKCKYCGDKFDDIYKMQYHLAICPHAEDELESSLVKNLTPKTTPMKPSIETPSSSVNGSNPPRKRGRPFKIRNVIPPQTEPENSDNNTSASHRTRSRITKQTVVNVDPSPNTQAKLARKPRRSIKGVSDFSEDCDDGVNESLGVSAKRLDESGSDDESRRKIHQCPHPSCGLKFTREKAMLCHYRNHEDSDGTVKCYKCGIPFDDDRELTTHIKECKSIKEENDSEDFEPVDEYDKKPYGKVRGGYMCKICGKTYITNDRLKRCFHEGAAESIHNCRLCFAECTNDEQLRKHFKTSHPDNLPYQCLSCSKEFNVFTSLTKHLALHEDNKCIVCFVKLLSCKDLYCHYSKDHVKNGQVCELCSKIFKSNKLFLNHKEYHKDEKRYDCEVYERCDSSKNVSMKQHTDKPQIMKDHSLKPDKNVKASENEKYGLNKMKNTCNGKVMKCGKPELGSVVKKRQNSTVTNPLVTKKTIPLKQNSKDIKEIVKNKHLVTKRKLVNHLKPNAYQMERREQSKTVINELHTMKGNKFKKEIKLNENHNDKSIPPNIVSVKDDETDDEDSLKDKSGLSFDGIYNSGKRTIKMENHSPSVLSLSKNVPLTKVSTSIRSRPMSFISFSPKTQHRLPSQFWTKKVNVDQTISRSYTTNISLAPKMSIFASKKDNSRCGKLSCQAQIRQETNKSMIASTLKVVKKRSVESNKTQKINNACAINPSCSNLAKDTENRKESVKIETKICKTEEFIKEGKFYEPSPNFSSNSCTICLMTFSSSSELLTHIAVHI